MAITSRVSLKACSICGTENPHTSEFFPFRKGEVLRGECKKCNAEYHVNWSKDNTERSREIKAKWNKANPEKHRGDPVKAKKAQAKWRKENPGRQARNARRWHLEKTYGLSLEDYHIMLAKQEGKCSMCGVDNNGKHENFYVDHDHKTGKVRSLLCKSCNFMVGVVETKEDLLGLSKQYLNKHTYYDYSI